MMTTDAISLDGKRLWNFDTKNSEVFGSSSNHCLLLVLTSIVHSFCSDKHWQLSCISCKCSNDRVRTADELLLRPQKADRFTYLTLKEALISV